MRTSSLAFAFASLLFFTGFAHAEPARADAEAVLDSPVVATGMIEVQGKCLDIPDSDASDHVRIQLFDCRGTANQIFSLRADGSISALGKCLDVPDSDASDHVLIQLFDCRNQLNQHFVTDGIGHLGVLGKCLDVPNAYAVDHAPIQLFDCREQENQSFVFVASY
jgi:hypothetical protein